MVADLNVHWQPENPHIDVMLTMREVSEDGFGYKVTEWNKIALCGSGANDGPIWPTSKCCAPAMMRTSTTGATRSRASTGPDQPSR